MLRPSNNVRWNLPGFYRTTKAVPDTEHWIGRMSLRIPSIYWPIAEIGFSRNRTRRRAFRFLFCRIYRKRLWNPVMNSWGKNKGFDARRYVFANNGHAVCSAVLLFLLFTCLYHARQCAAFSSLAMAHEERTCYLSAVVIATVELIYNAPAIVLSRYLYLITVRRPGLVVRHDSLQHSQRDRP